MDTKLLSAKELAKFLNVSLKFVEKYTALRRIPGQTKVGRVWRYDLRAIEKKLLSGELLLSK
jgi:hypothetical protein